MKQVTKLALNERHSLVTILDVLANRNKIAFSMELLSGGELFNRLRQKGKFSERAAALIMQRIMRGVQVLHANGIVHRDLKPENLLFENNDDDSKIKITDFGFAFNVGKTDLFHKSIVGTPGYIAPEILRAKTYTFACDIWSLGCILFILVVGRRPFGGSTIKELFENTMKGVYNFPAVSQILTILHLL